jgi:hypothetical protein
MSDFRRPDVRLAEDRVPGRLPYGFLAFAIVFSAVLVLAAWLLLDISLGSRARLPPPSVAPAAIAGVRQTLILEERPGQRLLREQREGLERWGWVDREAGIVQIPVDEAIRLFVEEP